MVDTNHLFVMAPMRWSKLPGRLCLACLVVAALQPLYSQPGPMELVAPTDRDITVVVYDVGRQPALARFFESPERVWPNIPLS